METIKQKASIDKKTPEQRLQEHMEKDHPCGINRCTRPARIHVPLQVVMVEDGKEPRIIENKTIPVPFCFHHNVLAINLARDGDLFLVTEKEDCKNLKITAPHDLIRVSETVYRSMHQITRIEEEAERQSNATKDTEKKE
jgi:hypothetical protein